MKKFLKNTMIVMGIIFTVCITAFVGFCTYLACTEDDYYDFDQEALE